MWEREYTQYLFNLISFLTDEEWADLESRAYLASLDPEAQSVDAPESALESFEAFEAWNQEVADETVSS